ncbi:MAG: TatD family hydrolase [Planctomycetota bacterium]
MITDTHAHVFWKDFDKDRDEIYERAAAAGVSRLVVVGTDVKTSAECFSICEGRDNFFPTAGIHPHDADEISDGDRAAIREMCERPECVAVGETGLDYFKGFSDAERQRSNFRWHLELARELDKPVVVHCRDAHEDTIALIREVPGVRGVMHCYTMGTEELPSYLEAGFYISFSGVVTYPKNEANRAAAREVQADRILVETDCPFLSPQGKRGKRNEPAYVALTLAHIAEQRGVSVEALAETTSANATRLFSLPA